MPCNGRENDVTKSKIKWYERLKWTSDKIYEFVSRQEAWEAKMMGKWCPKEGEKIVENSPTRQECLEVIEFSLGSYQKGILNTPSIPLPYLEAIRDYLTKDCINAE